MFMSASDGGAKSKSYRFFRRKPLLTPIEALETIFLFMGNASWHRQQETIDGQHRRSQRPEIAREKRPT
jgi:hypothetical protein